MDEGCLVLCEWRTHPNVAAIVSVCLTKYRIIVQKLLHLIICTVTDLMAQHKCFACAYVAYSSIWKEEEGGLEEDNSVV